MRTARQPARINVRALVILASVVVLLCGGAAAAYKIRKRVMANRALAAGKAALAKEDWAEASKQLKFYLSKYPDDQEMLARYGEANLSVRPREPANIGAAIGAYRRLLRRHPGDDEVCERLAQLYTLLRNFEEVAYVCRGRLEADPTDPDALLFLGQALKAQRKTDEAMSVLQTLVENDPGQVKAYALLSELAWDQDSDTAEAEAARWQDRCVETNPQSAGARAQRARFRHVIAKDKEAAKEDLKAADSLQPADPVVLLSLAADWMMLGDFPQAGLELEALARIDLTQWDLSDGDPNAFGLERCKVAGLLALFKADAEGGVATADRALEELTGNYRMAFLPLAVRLYLAGDRVETARHATEALHDAAQRLGRPDSKMNDQLALADAAVSNAEGKPYASIDLLEPLVAKNVQNAEAWKLLGAAYTTVGQGRRAIRAFEECFKAARADVDTALRLANAYRNRDLRKAAFFAAHAERLRPASLDAKLLRIEAELHIAAIREDSERMQQLSSDLLDLQKTHSRAARIPVLISLIAAHEHRVDDAIAGLEAAIAGCDDKLVPAMRLVEYCKSLGRTEKAIEVCREAIKTLPESALLRVSLSELMMKTGQEEEARKILEGASTESTGQEQVAAKAALAQFILAHGMRQEGVDRFKKLVQQQPENLRLRQWLLKIPEVQAEPEESQRIVDEIKATEGERGLLWRFEQARVWLLADDWRERQTEIEGLLAHCLGADPAWREPALVLGAMYEKLAWFGKAEETYRQLFQLNPADTVVGDRLLRLLESQRRFAEAQTLLETIRAEPSSLSKHRVLLAIGQGELEDATAELKALIKADPKDASSRILLARIVSEEAEGANRALKLLDEALAISEERLAIIDLKAQILRAAGREAEASELLNAEVERHNDFVAYLLRGRHLAAVGEIEAAENDFKHLTTLEESAAAGHHLLALFYVEQGREEEGIAALEAGLGTAPENVSLKADLARTLLSRKTEQQHQRGRELLDELLAKDPDNADFLQLRAAVLLTHDDDQAGQDARQILERIVEANPRAITAYLQLIGIERAAGDLGKAGELVTRALGANPNNVPLLLAKADLERRQGRPVIAHTLVRQALEGNPRHEDASVMQALIQEDMGERDRAIGDLESYTQKHAGDHPVKARATLANLHRLNGDLDAAQEQLDQAVLTSPDSPPVLLARLHLLAARGDFDGLAALLDTLTIERPEDASVVLEGTKILAARSPGHREKARSHVERILTYDPRSVDGYQTQAQLAFAADDLASCERAYRKVLEIRPDHPVALNDLAWILAEHKNELEAALELVNTGVARYPAHINLLDTRGVVLFRLKRFEEAESDLQKCIDLIGDNPSQATQRTKAQALFHLGRVYASEQNWAQAKERLTAALELDGKLGGFSEAGKDEIRELMESMPQ